MKATVRAASAAFPRFAAAGRALMAAALLAAWWLDIRTYLGSASPRALLLAASALLALVAAYDYVLARRFFRWALARRSAKTQEAAALLAGTALLVPAMKIFGTPALLALHTAVLGLLMEGVYRAGCRLGLSRRGAWRALYLSGAVPFLGMALLAGYGAAHIRHPVLTEYTVSTEKALPPGGYTIALVTDLHYGNALTREDLERDAAALAAKKPDLVLLCGDIVDERTTLPGLREAFAVLSRIPSRDGVYYVYGNHDKALYTSRPAFTADTLAGVIRAAGVTILDDESRILPSGLSLTGRKDRSDPMRTGIPRAEPSALMAGLPPEAYHILLDHQPRDMEADAAAGYDLMLSGHTHAGQIWPVGHLIALLDKGTILYGHEKRDGMDVIVSSGLVGWGYPLRTEGESEMVFVHLTNEKTESGRAFPAP